MASTVRMVFHLSQVDDAKIGLTQNVGGTGATVAVHIFGRDA